MRRVCGAMTGVLMVGSATTAAVATRTRDGGGGSGDGSSSPSSCSNRILSNSAPRRHASTDGGAKPKAAAARLNEYSERVRRDLQHRLVFTGAFWQERLVEALLEHRPAGAADDTSTTSATAAHSSSSSSSPSSSSASSAYTNGSSVGTAPPVPALHPLLCIRVLELLGHVTGKRRPPTPLLRRLQLAAPIVLRPLADLLERPLAAQATAATATPHTEALAALPPQLRPLVGVVLEWLCAFPHACGAARTGRLIHFYYGSTSSSSDCGDGPACADITESSRPVTPTPAAASAGDPWLPLPTLARVLVAALTALPEEMGLSEGREWDDLRSLSLATSPYSGDDARSRWEDERCGLSLVAAALVQHFAAQGTEGGKDGRPTSHHGRPTAQEKYLCDLLFWEGGELPRAARAGARLFLREFNKAAAAAAAAAVTATGAATTAAGEPAPDRNTLVIPFTDDEELRRLLLRLSRAQQQPILSPPSASHDNTESDAAAAAATAADAPVLIVPRYCPSSDGSTPPPPNTTRSAGGEERTSATADAATDLIPLRFATPLDDYMTHIAEGEPSGSGAPPACMRLGFVGFLQLVTPVLDTLQELRRASSCAEAGNRQHGGREQHHRRRPPRAAADGNNFTLMPHKPRLHSLKHTCEVVLRAVRARRACEEAATTTASGAAVSSSSQKQDNTSPAAPPPSLLVFDDVALGAQEAAARRLCGTCRALVRVVMDEKQTSLLREGPEGAALFSGGAAGGQRRKRQEEEAALAALLRNSAHRVVEPALWRHRYDPQLLPTLAAADEHLCVFPPAVFSLEDLAALFTFEGRDDGRAEGRQLRQRLRPAWEAASALAAQVGWDSAERTAGHVLRRPTGQPLAALVEGVRLFALRVLVFAGAAGLTEADARALSHGVVPAVQAAWGRLAPDSAHSSGSSPHASSGGEVRWRLLWCATCAAVRLAQKFPPQAPAGGGSLSALRATATATAAAADGPSAALERLLRLITGAAPSSGDSATDAVWECLGVPELLAAVTPAPAALAKGVEEKEKGEGGGVHFPPAGRAEAWETREELLGLMGAAPPHDVSQQTWRWLGSVRALHTAVEDLRALAPPPPSADSAGATPTPPTQQQKQTHLFFLLPWTTLAASRQPLRVYDEGGQSARAAAATDTALQQLFRYCLCQKENAPETEREGGRPAATSSPSSVRVTLRLVSPAEEAGFFAPVATTGALVLRGADASATLPVVVDGERREELMLHRRWCRLRAAAVAAQEAQVEKERRQSLSETASGATSVVSPSDASAEWQLDASEWDFGDDELD